MFFSRMLAYRRCISDAPTYVHALSLATVCLACAEAVLVATLLIAITFAADARAAQRLQAIPEMLARAQSIESVDAVHINDQRLEFQSLYGRVHPKGGVERSYRQLFRGIPIWGEPVVTIVDPNTASLRVKGHIIAEIADDIDTSVSLLDAGQIEYLVRAALTQHSNIEHELPLTPDLDFSAVSVVSDTSVTSASTSIIDQQTLKSVHQASLWIVLDKLFQARLAYEFCLSSDEIAIGEMGKNITVRALVDARTGQVLKLWRDTLENVLSDKHTLRAEPQAR